MASKQPQSKLLLETNTNTKESILDPPKRKKLIIGCIILTAFSIALLVTIILLSTSSTADENIVEAYPFEELNQDYPDQNVLTQEALTKLRALIDCNDKPFTNYTKLRGEYWSLFNYVRAEHGPLACHESVTYTTHGTIQFLDNVKPLVKSIRYLRDCSGSDLIKNLVTFHLFFSNKELPSMIPSADVVNTPFNCSIRAPYLVNASTTFRARKNLTYPINVARNIAREAALTHFVLPSDVELYPSPNLVPRFLNMIARNEKPLNTSTKPRVFPLSIFEVSSEVHVPSNKSELQRMLANNTAIPFHKELCPLCHTLPRASEWMKANETKFMKVVTVSKRRGCFAVWEPIFIGTNEDPWYDERLSWEGKQDKMTQGYELCALDYDFMILNNPFLVHKPGIKGKRKDGKRESLEARQNSLIVNVILPELNKKYGTAGEGCYAKWTQLKMCRKSS